jgi:hypothetical protein
VAPVSGIVTASTVLAGTATIGPGRTIALSRGIEGRMKQIAIFHDRKLQGHPALPPLPDPRSRPDLSQRRHTSIARHGHPGQACRPSLAPRSRTVMSAGRILRRPFLGGLHHEYVRILFLTGTGLVLLRHSRPIGSSPKAPGSHRCFKKSESPSAATQQSNRSVRDGKTPDVAGWSKLPP